MSRFFILTFICLIFAASCGSDKNGTETPSAPIAQLSELDTFYAGKTLYCIKDTSAEYFNSVFKTKFDTSEANRIQLVKDVVKRAGDTLLLTLENGSKKTFINQSSIESDNFTEYHFISRLQDVNYYLMKVYFYEAFSYLMVNAKSGKETYLCGIPAISPDKSKVIAGCFDLQAGFVFNGLQLFEITSDSLSLTWSRELTKWGADNLAWINNSSFIAEQIQTDSLMNTTTKYITLSECH